MAEESDYSVQHILQDWRNAIDIELPPGEVLQYDYGIERYDSTPAIGTISGVVSNCSGVEEASLPTTDEDEAPGESNSYEKSYQK